jgi:hypothetical protein
MIETYEEKTAISEPMTYGEVLDDFEPLLASRWQFFWLCCVILSFCYELPLVRLTTMDRLNPRFFDVVFLVGVITVLPGLNRAGQTHKVFRLWAGIVAIFAFCALVWAPFFPWYYGKYTIWYALKYLQGLLVMYMIIKIPITASQKRILHYLVIVGGTVVALVAAAQYLRGGVGTIYVARTGEELKGMEGILFSSLGRGYFHTAIFSSLSSVMTLVLFPGLRTTISKMFCLVLTVFIGWPAFFCGSRAGPVACLLSWGFLFLLAKISFKTVIIIVVITTLLFLSVYVPKMLSMEYWAEKSLSFKRMVTIEESGGGGFNTLSERLNMYTVSLMRLYRWQGLRVPFIGAGFYVAPHTHPDGTLKYRTGYGVHNSYLFALEQGGLGAFILFIAFLIACHKNLKIMRKPYNNESDRSFATGMHAFFFALLIVMLPGQIFWHGFQKVNFNTYLILLFMIACMNSYFWENEGTSFYNDTLGDNDTFGDNKTLVDNEN